MKKIADLVELIDEEIEGAKNYAEKYLDFKAQNKTEWASKFKKMAEDELAHSTNIHTFALEEIEQLKKVYTAPVDMQEAWNKSHKGYVERVAWIKQMLAM